MTNKTHKFTLHTPTNIFLIYMQEFNNQPQFPSERQESRTRNPGASRKSSAKKIYLILGLVLVILAAGALFLLSRSPETEEEAPQQEFETITFEENIEEQPSPTPTSEPIDKSEIKIQVLNGTGIARQAAYLEGILLDLGYEDINTGNADQQDYDSTQVTFASDLSDQVRQEIFDELEKVYQRVQTSTQELEDYDVSIIAGLRQGQELPSPTPTSQPQPTPTEAEAEETTPTPTATPTP